MRPIAADAVVVSGGRVLLLRRKNNPYRGYYVFPGGFLEREEELLETARRELKEETSINAELIGEIGSFSSPLRDPRKTISVAFLLFSEDNPKESKEGRPRWFPIYEALRKKLGFDHAEILRKALNLLVHSYIDTMLEEGWRRKAPVLFIDKGRSEFWKLAFIVLSARTKDEKTAEALSKLQENYEDEHELSNASVSQVEALIRGVGFHRQKARRLVELAKIISAKGIPDTKEALQKLPGVGPKTANVFLAEVKKKPSIGVDTNVHRISNRLGLVNTKTPAQTEKDLHFLNEQNSRRINLAFVSYGQTICKPLAPLCSECPLSKFCKYSFDNRTGYWRNLKS